VELLQGSRQQCPSCGEPIELTVDLSCGDQAYVEDCAVCCAPMQVRVRFTPDPDAPPAVEVCRENE
jgi:hypothetical protein